MNLKLPTPEELARWTLPLAALAAAAALSRGEVDPAGALETAYLGFLAAAVLLPLGTLAPPPARELAGGAVLTAAVLVGFPVGPARGAVLLAALLAVLALAAGRRLRASLPALPLGVTLPLALALQLLLRGDLLLAPEPRSLVALLALPLLGGAAVSRLARRCSGKAAVPALLAAATALVLGPGWNVASTLALAALAAGDFLAESGRHASRYPGLARLAALAVLLAPVAWQPRTGLLIALAGLALWRPRWAVIGALAATGAAMAFPLPAGQVAYAWFLWLPLLLPGLLFPARERLWPLAAALLLASAGRAAPGEAALAAPLALAALCLPRRGPGTSFQTVWTAFVLAGTALLAAYPWLRERPVEAWLSLLGPLPFVAVFALAAGALVAAGFAWLGSGLGERGRPLGRWPELATLALLAGAVLPQLPGPVTPLLAAGRAEVLDSARPRWTAKLSGPSRGVVLESSLTNGAGLPAGTPVAVVRLGRGAREWSWTLRAGRDTGDWAARRPDVRAQFGAGLPGWTAFVGEGFFGQRYRSARRLPAAAYSSLTVERAAGLPADVGFAVHQIEIAR